MTASMDAHLRIFVPPLRPQPISTYLRDSLHGKHQRRRTFESRLARSPLAATPI